MIKTIKLSDVKSRKQDFILKKVMPIPISTVSMLSAPGGVAKTWLGLRVAMTHTIDTNEDVLVWMSEDEPEFVKGRAESLTQFCNVEAHQEKIHVVETAPPQLAFKNNGIFTANYEAFRDIRGHCIDRGIKFVIIDPLLAFYGGEENNNAQARVFMQPFLEWAKNDGVTILLIHHSKKDGTGTRGASAFVDATRTVYELDFVKVKKGDDMVKNHIATDQGLRMLKLVKDNRYVQGILKADGRGGEYEISVTPEYKASV